MLPGVHALLDRLTRHEALVLGLLTGNIEQGAWMKVEAAGLATFFETGAFGDRAKERNELPALAVEAARVKTGHAFEGKDVVIIGDTPNDVLCGRGLYVTSLAVATGGYSRAELAEFEPDFLFDDLTETSAVFKAIAG